MIDKKNEFWFMVIVSAIMAVFLAVLEVSFWGHEVPKELAQGAIDNSRLCQYVVDNMPELEGASTSEISFNKDGMYYVTYRGKMYIIDDAAMQNNIEAFMKKYHGSCDYEYGIKSHYGFFSGFTAVIAAILIGICMADAVAVLKKLRKERRHIIKLFNAV